MNKAVYESKLEERLAYYEITKFAKIHARDLTTSYKNCAYCDAHLDENNYSVEHIENPVSKDDFERTAKIKDNIVLCCRTCNRSKGNKTLKEWLENIKKSRTSLPKEKIKSIENCCSNSKNDKIKKAALQVFSKKG